MNTIYDGTFVLGQTSAVNIQAGPGISITEPTAGTVRIANDETVLWNSAVSGSAFNITLSEPPVNFERLEFIGYTNDGIKYPMYGWGYTDNFSAIATQDYYIRTTTYGHDKVMWFTVNSAGGITGLAQKERNLTATGAAYNAKNNFSFAKVIGINRITGNNA